MKSIIKNIVFIFIAVFLVNCENKDKIKVDFGAPNPAGNFVTADITVPVINGDDIPGGTFELTVDAPANNVSKYEMYVRRITPDNVATDYSLIKTVTSFPSNVVITTQDLADVFGIGLSDLNLGDSFEFLNKSTSSVDGSVTDVNTIDPDLLSEAGQKQAYKLSTQIICPIPSDYAVGRYNLELVSTENGFGPTFLDGEVDIEPVVVGGVPSVYQRTFKKNYLEGLGIGQPDMDFVFVYFCGLRNAAENMNTHLGCSGTITFNPGTPMPYSLNFDDDDEIIINFTEDLSGCGGSATTQTTIKLTKI